MDLGLRNNHIKVEHLHRKNCHQGPLTYFEEFHDGLTRSEGKFRLKLITHDGIFYSELDQSVMATHRSLRSWKLCSYFKCINDKVPIS